MIPEDWLYTWFTIEVIIESTEVGNTWITAVMTSALVTGGYCTMVIRSRMIGIMHKEVCGLCRIRPYVIFRNISSHI